jgi:F-type H+-transporting ATPase subunit a
MAAEHSDVFHHIRDFRYFELPSFLGGHSENLPTLTLPGGYELHLTKFMVLQVVAGLIVTIIFTGLARHIRTGQPARGRFWNFWEMLALFIRDEVVRPAIGTGHHDHGEGHDHGDHGHGDIHAEHLGETLGDPPAMNLGGMSHDGTLKNGPPDMPAVYSEVPPTGEHPADKYLPYIWSCFFYVLIANLLGAIPWLGSATGNISVTGALAIVTFLAVIVSGSRKLGVVGFWKALVPGMDLPGPIALVLLPGIWLIEFVGLIIKHGVLAVRLFANIMAGHTVIAVILGFIAQAAAPDVAAAYPWLFWVVTPASILGQIGVGLLELFVAFLQAYIFAFLSALFIGAAVHPH